MSAGSVAAVLGSLAFFVLKYSVIWLALYFARYIVVLWVSRRLPFSVIANNSVPTVILIVFVDVCFIQIVDPYRSYLRFLPGPPINGRFVDQQLWDLQK
jgi:hypothetical protein